MGTCWTCARFYDPKTSSSPVHYCSNGCADRGSRPYNQPRLNQIDRQQRAESFATMLVNKLHYLQHNNDDRFDCKWDLCVEAKTLGL
jgi:hypothetical protein